MINRNLYYYSKILFSFTIFAFANIFFTLSSTQFLYNSDGSSYKVLNARWIFAFIGCIFAYSTFYTKDRKREFSIIIILNAILFLILPFCRNQYLFTFIVFCYGFFIYILQLLPILFVIELKRGTKYLSACLQIIFIFQSLDELLGRQIIKWIYEYDENTGKSTQKPDDDSLFGTASNSSLWIPFLAISCIYIIIAGLFWPLKDEFLPVSTEIPEDEPNTEGFKDELSAEYKREEVIQISIENQDISSENQIEMNIDDQSNQIEVIESLEDQIEKRLNQSDQSIITEKNQLENVYIVNSNIEKNYQSIEQIDSIENQIEQRLNQSNQIARIDEIETKHQFDENTKIPNLTDSNAYANFFIIIMGMVIGIILAIQENVKTYFLLSNDLNESELDESESKSTIQLIFASTILISRLINMVITFRDKKLTFQLMILKSLVFIFIGNLIIAFRLTIFGIIVLGFGLSSIQPMVILFCNERVTLNLRRICLLYLMISIFQLMKTYITAPFSGSASSMFFFMNCLFTSISFLFYFQLMLIDFCKKCLEVFQFMGSFMG